jgi:hypothetical protein
VRGDHARNESEKMKNKNRFSKAFEERLTWKPGDLVMLNHRAAFDHGIDTVRAGLHEACAEHAKKSPCGRRQAQRLSDPTKV